MSRLGHFFVPNLTLMVRLFKFSLSLYVCTSFLSVDSLQAKNGVVVNQTMGHDGVSRDYYHLSHRLEPNNFTLITPSEWLQCHYCIVWEEPIDPQGCLHNRSAFNDSGGFTLYLDKSSFAVESGCKSEWLKLKMKTLGEGAQTEAAIDAKRQLWESIQKVAAEELAHLDVVLELSPYCRVINAEPLEVRLDYCNVSFRSVDGYYVDHTGAVIVTPILP
jgi:hypothetical protein